MQLLLSLLFYWLIFIPGTTSDYYENNGNGNRIAIHIGSADTLPTNEQLQFANSLGIDLIEIADPTRLHSAVLQDFYILLSSRNKFITKRELSEEKSALINRTEQNYRGLSTAVRDRVAAVSIAKYPADFTEDFLRQLSIAADSLSRKLNKPIYYQSGLSNPLSFPQTLGFISVYYDAKDSPENLTSPVVFFSPDIENHRNSVQNFEEVLNNSLGYETSIVIVPSHWFFDTLEHQPDIALLISAHLNGELVNLPLPAETLPGMEANWQIILLFSLFAVLILHYKYQPFFLSFAARYYFNHSFFVADLFEGRVRSKSSGLVIIILHAVATGHLFHVLSGYLISFNGFSALTFYLPQLFLAGYEQFILFIAGFLLALSTHVISIFWIFILNKKISQIVQAMHLYCWPLLLNILIAAFAVVFIEIGYGSAVILTLSALFFVVWFMSFNIAAIDGSRQLEKNPVWYLTFTVILHAVLIVATVVFLLFTPWLMEPVQLIFSLP